MPILTTFRWLPSRFARSLREKVDRDIEYRIVLPDGVVRWVQGKGQVALDAHGNVLGMSGVCTDITERKRAEEERAQLLAREQSARTEAERANRLKDEFLATVFHELRTPLAPVLGWAQLLQTASLDESTRERALSVIEHNCKIQGKTIEDRPPCLGRQLGSGCAATADGRSRLTLYFLLWPLLRRVPPRRSGVC